MDFETHVLAQESNFVVTIEKLPALTAFVQSVTLPGFRAPTAKQGTKLIEVQHPGDQLDKDDLLINFSLDEPWKTYLELFNWTHGLGFPEDFKQHEELQRSNAPIRPSGIKSGLYSDITVQVLSNMKNVRYEFTYTSAFPTSLPPVPLTSKTEKEEVISLDISFSFTSVKIRVLP